MSDAASPFSPEVQAAVSAHMNTDHPEDSLLIVQALGSQPDATAATMVGYDPDGASFDATVGTDTVTVQIPWDRPVTERGDLRLEMARMYHDACEQLGIDPRTDEAH